jgi:Flp pilus assembly protein TadB
MKSADFRNQVSIRRIVAGDGVCVKRSSLSLLAARLVMVVVITSRSCLLLNADSKRLSERELHLPCVLDVVVRSPPHQMTLARTGIEDD